MLILKKFGAMWCGPCKVLSPMLREVCESYSVTLEEIDIDRDPRKMNSYSFSSIPYLSLEKDGTRLWNHVGSISKKDLISTLEYYMDVKK